MYANYWPVFMFWHNFTMFYKFLKLKLITIYTTIRLNSLFFIFYTHHTQLCGSMHPIRRQIVCYLLYYIWRVKRTNKFWVQEWWKTALGKYSSCRQSYSHFSFFCKNLFYLQFPLIIYLHKNIYIYIYPLLYDGTISLLDTVQWYELGI